MIDCTVHYSQQSNATSHDCIIFSTFFTFNPKISITSSVSFKSWLYTPRTPIYTMSTSRSTIMPILKRSFHASTSRRSHIGSLPIRLPQSVTLSLPPTSISPSLPASSPLAQRLVTITGPLGTQTLPILPPIILTNHDSGLTVSVHDAEERSQRSLWGLTRSLINNAVKGVSEGCTVELRLVGVGYRGAVEPIPKVFLDLQSQMPRIARPSKPGAPPYVLPPLPTERLNLKLGYAHPVLIDIPAGITVTTPAPTKILLSGTDKQKLGLFAAKIRRWRKPEPYRGKVSHSFFSATDSS
jgi:large subunit ribosomal protein L6